MISSYLPARVYFEVLLSNAPVKTTVYGSCTVPEYIPMSYIGTHLGPNLSAQVFTVIT